MSVLRKIQRRMLQVKGWKSLKVPRAMYADLKKLSKETRIHYLQILAEGAAMWVKAWTKEQEKDKLIQVATPGQMGEIMTKLQKENPAVPKRGRRGKD